MFNSIITPKISQFYNIYLNLIQEKYNIFPVPQLFIKDLIKTIQLKMNNKTYLCKNILTKYCKNWKYYHIFKFNMNKMLENNISASITLLTFSTNSQLKNILNTYKPEDKNVLKLIDFNETHAVIYDYSNNFDLALLVNLHNTKTTFEIYKAIQHQLIHWMQVVLNIDFSTYGIFNNFNNSLTIDDKKFLNSCLNYNENDDTTYIENSIQYVLNSIEFQAWCANSVENFEYLNLNLQQFETTIKNKNIFKSQFLTTTNQYYRELLMFTQICYLASLNNPSDDRYWYLIECIKQN